MGSESWRIRPVDPDKEVIPEPAEDMEVKFVPEPWPVRDLLETQEKYFLLNLLKLIQFLWEKLYFVLILMELKLEMVCFNICMH